MPPPLPPPIGFVNVQTSNTSGKVVGQTLYDNGATVVDSRGGEWDTRSTRCGRCSRHSGGSKLPSTTRRRHRAKENGRACQARRVADRARAHQGRETYPPASGHGVCRARVRVDDVSVQGGWRGADCECPLLSGVVCQQNVVMLFF